MYYVADNEGIIREFETFAKAAAWWEAYGDDDMWISSYEDF